MTAGPQIRSEVYYSGRVQGVGFRFTAQHVAARYQVTGRVRNLPDGRVHLVAEGEPGEVERFLAAVAESMSGNIEHADRTVKPATGEYQSFEISR